MLHSLRLRNLRSFADDENAPYVDIKPITVLIGKNSSGKSSFLRSFPLLRQSIEANTTGPILWYDSYVDFGAFSEAKKFDSKDNIIYFDFKFDIQINNRRNFMPKFRWNESKRINRENLLVSIKIGVTETNKKTVAKELILDIHNHEYKFILNKDQKCELFINNELEMFSDELKHLSINQFLPIIGTMSKEGDLGYRFNDDAIYDNFSEKLYLELKPYFQGNTSESTIKNGLARIGINERNDIKSILTKTFRNNKTFINNLEKKENVICEIVYELSLSANLDTVLRNLNDEIERTFRNIKYIAPLRATAERYYRHQDLQVKEIDHTGSNLAMLLRSFSSLKLILAYS